MDYYIREWKKEDIPAMIEVEHLCFSDPWTEEMFLSEFNNSITKYYVAEVATGGDFSGGDFSNKCPADNHRLIAYVGFLYIAGECQINNVAVHPDYRKHGIASELLELIINEVEDMYYGIIESEGSIRAYGIQDDDSAESMKEFDRPIYTLEVRRGNEPAINLYKKFGFQIVGERPGYYDDGTDAILMTK